jgi:hypothetical protein
MRALMDEGEALPLDRAIEYALGGELQVTEAKP